MSTYTLWNTLIIYTEKVNASLSVIVLRKAYYQKRKYMKQVIKSTIAAIAMFGSVAFAAEPAKKEEKKAEAKPAVAAPAPAPKKEEAKPAATLSGDQKKEVKKAPKKEEAKPAEKKAEPAKSASPAPATPAPTK